MFFKIAVGFLIGLWLNGNAVSARELPIYPSQNNIAWSYYRVGPGDSFYKLFKNEWPWVARFNRMDKNHLISGDRIKAPKNIEEAKNYEPMPPFIKERIEERKKLEKSILVNLEEQWLGAYEKGKLIFSAPISSGRLSCQDEKTKKIKNCETPTGLFETLAFHRDHFSSVYKDAEENAIPMPYASMFFIDEQGIAYWLHSGDLPGYPASHGCIRLFKEDAKKLCEFINPKCSENENILWLKEKQRIVIDVSANSNNIHSGSAFQGDPVIIPLKSEVDPNDLEGFLTVQEKKYNLVFFKKDSKTYALVGIDLYLAPGDYPLAIYQKGNDGPIEEKIINVKKGKFKKSVSQQWNRRNWTDEENARIEKEHRELILAYQNQSPENYWLDGFDWPVEKQADIGQITSPFGQQRVNPKNKKSRLHHGTDFRAPAGYPIKAIAAGHIVHLGYDYFLEGNITVIDHGAGIFSFYLHQSEFSVKIGDFVKKGDIVGKVGSTGNSNAPHLHLAVRINTALTDPVKLIEMFK
ncbi:MAG: peptidoglycan DD-metalloendopeptidase family protein [Parcubacteria group bacterium]|nr:peptidoglycan DD-metalloendopeptidase family protein [Parcubacteria group bacterium]